jgi:hypothetical protein
LQGKSSAHILEIINTSHGIIGKIKVKIKIELKVKKLEKVKIRVIEAKIKEYGPHKRYFQVQDLLL